MTSMIRPGAAAANSRNGTRIAQRPLPPSGPRPRTFPNRAGRVEVSVPSHPCAGPDRPLEGTMGNEVEASTQRVRNRIEGRINPSGH